MIVIHLYKNLFILIYSNCFFSLILTLNFVLCSESLFSILKFERTVHISRFNLYGSAFRKNQKGLSLLSFKYLELISITD